jgi:transcriptional regulator with XRE-family HTH domain
MTEKSLGQGGLAHEIGVSPSRISEYRAGKRSPSSDVLWKLGKLAAFPQNLWFWEQAGLSKEDILAAARAIGETRLVLPKEGEMFLIPPFQRDTEEGKARKPIRLTEDFNVDPLFTRYLIVDEPVRMGAIERGDIVMIDTSADCGRSLEPLWNKLVLLKLSRPPGKPPLNWSLAEEQSQGFYLGILRCKADISFRGGRAGLKDWVVVIERFRMDTSIHTPGSMQSGDPEFCAGEMKITQEDWKLIGTPMSREELPIKEPEVARVRFKLFDGIAILGRAIGWFRPPSKSGE